MDGNKEFVEDFKELCDELREAGIEATVEQAVNLFAIFSKDLRTERINGEKDDVEVNSTTEGQQATEKQKQFLKRLADERGIDISEDELEHEQTRSQQQNRSIARGRMNPPILLFVTNLSVKHKNNRGGFCG